MRVFSTVWPPHTVDMVGGVDDIPPRAGETVGCALGVALRVAGV